mmetsp:Transcript_21014/g.30337  ORF Transcript_21014/g.30337 Transcript_21014/m.30337 type:complete len:765 (+) Transcript_21014:80-2374(+)
MDQSISEQITSLRSEIKSYGSDIVNHVSALYSQHKGTVDLKSDPRNVLKILQHDVHQLLREARESSDYNSKYMSDIAECESMASTLEQISAASKSIAHFEEMLVSSDIDAACNALHEMDEHIRAVPTENSVVGSGAVCDMLRRESKLLRSRFVSRVRRLLRDCVQVSRGRINVLKELSGILRSDDTLLTSSIPLSNIWTVLLSCGGSGCAEAVERVVTEVWTDVIAPLWREKKSISPRTVNGDNRSEMLIELSCAEISAVDVGSDTLTCGTLPPCRMKYAHLLDTLGQIMGFLYSEVFCSDERVLQHACEAFNRPPSGGGICLLPALRDTLVSIIPKTESEMELFQGAVTGPIAEFEKKVELFGLLPETEVSGEGLLSAAARDIRGKFLEARRYEVLTRARTLVLGDYHNTMLGTGDALEDDQSTAGTIGDPREMLEQSGSTFSFQALPFEPCQISLAACRLLKLVHEVMKQACSSKTPELASMLYQSARDCFEIFAACVQSKFADVIETVPRMGAVFYNDCCYIAHNATLITHAYRQDIGAVNPDLQGCVGFVDFIPRFRAMGERCLQGHVEEQKKTLLVLLGKVRVYVAEEEEADEFSGGGPLGPDMEGSNSEEAAAVLVKHMGRLKGQWQSVLQESVYNRLVGFLLEVVLRRAMRPVLEAKYISESTATDVSRVFKIIQKSRSVFSDARDDESLLTLVGSWGKFCALSDLLEFSLSEIAEWLPRRKFSSFTGNEMASLVRALFEDSARRQNILSSILEISK